jgi:hypothetical protein
VQYVTIFHYFLPQISHFLLFVETKYSNYGNKVTGLIGQCELKIELFSEGCGLKFPMKNMR